MWVWVSGHWFFEGLVAYLFALLGRLLFSFGVFLGGI